MSCVVDSVRNLRIQVEPVQVELDDDNGIRWTSLQTAFPGCSGLYYKDPKDSCKCSVKFDGQKFQAPGGAWNDREYFVSLSRCSNTALNSYESATKQFEKNVHLVQQLMTGMSTRRTKHHSPLSSHSATVTDNSENLDKEILQKTSTSKDLSPLEQQFVDLAKISTGKDTIIEAQRQEIAKFHNVIQQKDEQLSSISKQLEAANSRVEALENELNLLTTMAQEQTTTNNQVDSLTKQLEKTQAALETLQKTHEEDVKKIQYLSDQLSASSQEITQLKEDLKVTQVSKEVISQEMDQLRPLAEAIQIESSDEVLLYLSMKEEVHQLRNKTKEDNQTRMEMEQAYAQLIASYDLLARENTQLMERNEELEKRMSHVDEELTKINEEWKEKIQKMQEQWNVARSEAGSEVSELKTEISNLQRLLESATRDATDNARRRDDAERTCQSLKKTLESTEFRHQEPLKLQISALEYDLKEAETKIVELTSLVHSLASDERNIRRDIDDFI